MQSDNVRAIRFYDRRGFIRVRLLPRAILHNGTFAHDLLMVGMLDA